MMIQEIASQGRDLGRVAVPAAMNSTSVDTLLSVYGE